MGGGAAGGCGGCCSSVLTATLEEPVPRVMFIMWERRLERLVLASSGWRTQSPISNENVIAERVIFRESTARSPAWAAMLRSDVLTGRVRPISSESAIDKVSLSVRATVSACAATCACDRDMNTS